MFSKHFLKCGWTARGFFAWANISNNSSSERKYNRGKIVLFASKYSVKPLKTCSRRKLHSLRDSKSLLSGQYQIT